MSRTSKPPEDIDRSAIRALLTVIVTCVGGIIAVSITGQLIQADMLAGLFDNIEQDPDAAINTDEALSLLGTVASASAGALAGWLTHRYVASREGIDPDELEAFRAWQAQNMASEPAEPLNEPVDVQDDLEPVEAEDTSGFPADDDDAAVDDLSYDEEDTAGFPADDGEEDEEVPDAQRA